MSNTLDLMFKWDLNPLSSPFTSKKLIPLIISSKKNVSQFNAPKDFAATALCGLAYALF